MEFGNEVTRKSVMEQDRRLLLNQKNYLDDILIYNHCDKTLEVWHFAIELNFTVLFKFLAKFQDSKIGQ